MTKSKKIRVNIKKEKLSMPTRRRFLKMLVGGVGVFLIGNFLNRGDALRGITSSNTKNNFPKNLNLSENEKEIILYNKRGEEIMIIDKNI